MATWISYVDLLLAGVSTDLGKVPSSFIWTISSISALTICWECRRCKHGVSLLHQWWLLIALEIRLRPLESWFLLLFYIFVVFCHRRSRGLWWCHSVFSLGTLGSVMLFAISFCELVWKFRWDDVSDVQLCHFFDNSFCTFFSKKLRPVLIPCCIMAIPSTVASNWPYFGGRRGRSL